MTKYIIKNKKMKKFYNLYFFKLFILFIVLNLSKQMLYYPDEYKVGDLIIPENDIGDQYQYNLVDAKVLTNQLITLYIKKQGITLDRDDCCSKIQCENLNVWGKMIDESELEEIYSNSVYNKNGDTISYDFPVPLILNDNYTLYHKVWVFENGVNNFDIFFNDDDDPPIFSNIGFTGEKKFVNIIITYDKTNEEQIISLDGTEIRLSKTYYITKINFKFSSDSMSPAISLHWTYYKIKLGLETANFSLKGTGICSYSNPCIKGYTCVGGLCEKCHSSCYDCKNGGLTTDCDSKCSTHSSRLTPDRGSCPLGYVDLSNFDSFTLKDLVPPTRNNRFTISFWFFLTSFPQNEIIGSVGDEKDYSPFVVIANSYSTSVNYTLYFSNTDLTITCTSLISESLRSVNTWYFVKCGNSGVQAKFTLYIRYFDGGFHEDVKGETDDYGAGYGQNNEGRVYSEPEDYITFWFEGFNSLYNNDVPFKFYIKQFVVFREYVQDPYDNKYFSFEKIFTSTFELPEVMFIIPFDELIRNDNKYDVKCYSYQGSIYENRITLTPYYYNKNYTLDVPKLFRRLNLLGRNQKYISPDLIKIDDVLRDNNTLIASDDYCPITCIDNFFLTYIKKRLDPGMTYYGMCTADCEIGYSSQSGLSEKKGFCNKKCSDAENAPICLNNNEDLLHLRSKFKCKSGYFEIFNNCDELNDEKERNNVFLFNHDQGPANIVLDVINYNLISYIIEVWIYLSRCTVGDDGTPYKIFYTNQFYIDYDWQNYVSYIKTDANRIVYKTDEIKYDKWNHILF